MYRAGGGVDVVVDDIRFVPVCDENGNSISDHNAAECEFTFIKTEAFTENTGELKEITTSGVDFFYQLSWIFKALIMIFSDIDNLSAILGELF